MEKRYPATIMATACIPWDGEFNFLPKVFEKQIRHLVDNGMRHIYLFGTAGEGYAVGNRQFRDIVSSFAMAMSGPGLHPMIGLIDMSLPGMIEKLEFARGLGIRDFQFSLPCWGALNDDELYSFFNHLLKPYPDCRFMNYNLARTKRFMEPGELFELAKLHRNFVGVKHTRGTESDFSSITSSDTPLQFFMTEFNFHRLSKSTECGLLLSIGNLDYEGSRMFFNSCANGEHAQTGPFMEKMKKARSVIKDTVSFPAIDGAYDKLYTRYNLPEFHHRLLPPYQYVDEQNFSDFKSRLDSILK